MINEMEKIIFIHPPKTGGWSIIDLFGNCSVINEFGNTEWSPLHYSMQHYRNKKINLENYLVFANTRNPWERMVSAYLYLLDNQSVSMNGRSKRKKEKHISKMTMEDYIAIQTDDEIHMEHDGDNRYWFYLSPVMDWVSADGEILVDYFCSIHTYEEDFKLVSDIIGNRKKLPHANRSKHEDYRTYYTDKMVDMVGSIYRKDIEYFGFEFDDSSKSNFRREVNPEKIGRYRERRKLLVNGVTKL